ncbi:helix-turn-helix domain-containing protein [Chitinophagaceae bacterium LB-8]|uniref:Helix-turn-helix domain-containing protein n=1 Tax=Paraflavisolibacter caeni TaxID=2982496 RepID=A0A9X3BGW8_9BACT|nr:helix-turn-helix domain-containing protein [Paraflavisolibacter caeni]MCU7548168.1 helix-turn-helix domain-containing protein [Paraflavisolibacter caeni]
MDEIFKRLDEIVGLIKNQSIYLKEVMTFSEACLYCNFPNAHMYRLVSQGGIPHYKPNGKMIFFRRTELDTWLLRKRNFTKDELKQVVTSFLLEKSNADKLNEQWIDSQDVMQALHISKRKLQTLRDNGSLPFTHIEHKLYYKVSDVEALLEQSYVTSKPDTHGTK